MRRKRIVVLGIAAALVAPLGAAQVRLQRAVVNSTFVEIESATTSVSAGRAVVQDMRPFGGGWGGGAQLFWRPPPPVGRASSGWPYLALTVGSPGPGDYELVLDYTGAPDYGDFQVILAGEVLAEVSGFAARVERRSVALGRHTLTARSLQLVFAVFGRARQSTGFLVGLDRLVMTPVPAGAARSSPPGLVALAPGALRLLDLNRLDDEEDRAAALMVQAAGAFSQPRLEVYRDPAGFDDGSALLDWSQPALRPRFRWRSDQPGVARVVWGLATERFPNAAGVAAKDLLNMGFSQRSETSEWTEFEIDLSPYVPRDQRRRRPGAPPQPFDPAAELRHLYVRVTAVDADGRTIGRPSRQIDLFFGRPGKLKLPEGANPPRITLAGYQPPRPFTWDFQCRGLVTRDHDLGIVKFRKGQVVDLCKPRSKDFLDHLADAISSVADLIGDAIDWAAGVYNDAKAKAIGTIVETLEKTTGCGEECKWAVGVAADAGLAAAGMPPSLPDFDQVVAGLEQDGIDALAGGLADAAVSQGVSPVLAGPAARVAADELVREARKAAAGGSGGAAGFWRVDPAGLYSPAVIVLEARNLDSSRPTDEVYVEHSSPIPPRGRFLPGGMKVERLAPGSSLLLSFELEPRQPADSWMLYLPSNRTMLECMQKGDLAGCLRQFGSQRDEAKAKLEEWVRLHVEAWYSLELALSAGGASSDIAQVHCAGNAAVCNVEYREPRLAGRRVDWCLNWGRDCGGPAAAAFCDELGYAGPLSFEPAENIGDGDPTRTLGDRRSCSARSCDGFASIICGPVETTRRG